MIRSILLKALEQNKRREMFFTIWAWIYSQTNELGIYYGTIKSICLNCKATYAEVNGAFELQRQWNKIEFEKTIILRKDDVDFKPNHNFFETKFYFTSFNIDLFNLKSQYKPIIIIFNTRTTAELKKPLPHENKLNASEARLLSGVGDSKEPSQLNGQTNKKAELPEKIKKKIEKELINACLDIYIAFYKERLEIAPKIDALQIKSLKSMVGYFRANNRDQEKTDAGVLKSFDIIFLNWDKYPEFYKQQFKLSQISSNLVNIIGFIKTENKKMNLSKTQKIFDFEKNIQTLIDSGAMNNVIQNLGKTSHEKQAT